MEIGKWIEITGGDVLHLEQNWKNYVNDATGFATSLILSIEQKIAQLEKTEAEKLPASRNNHIETLEQFLLRCRAIQTNIEKHLSDPSTSVRASV